MTSATGEKDNAEHTERMRKGSKCCGKKSDWTIWIIHNEPILKHHVYVLL